MTSEQARLPGDEDARPEQLGEARRARELVVVPDRREEPRDLPLRRHAVRALADVRLVEALVVRALRPPRVFATALPPATAS